MAQPAVQIFGLAKSKATRKAQRFFSDRAISVHFVDCKVRAPSPGELRRWVQRFSVEEVLDPESKAYDDQGLRFVSAGEDDWLRRMTESPEVIRFPLVRAGNELTVGDDPAGWKRIVDEVTRTGS